MTIQKTIQTAESAWESWNDLELTQRKQQLEKWLHRVETPELAQGVKLAGYHLAQADRLLVSQEMPGPTGETNTLYCAGRGTFVIAIDESAPLAALLGQMAAVLVAGNCAILALPDPLYATANKLVSLANQAGIPAAVLQHVSESQLQQLLASKALAGLAYSGPQQAGLVFNRQLAEREGPLGQLVLDFQLETLGQPDYLLRFITERTRTINITAVGGNSSLLELGSGE